MEQRYEVLRQLRPEPWGDVWLAKDRLTGAEVALKLLPRDYPDAAAALKLYEQEAGLALRLRHPDLLAVLHLEASDNLAYLVEEPFAGESLMLQFARQERPDLAQSLDLIEAIAEALAAAHYQGLAHQSLNPCHVLVDGDAVRLAHFAFPAPAGDDALFLELRAYDPPEVIYGGAPIPASNVFSLGVLGFRLIAGSLPYARVFDEPFPYRMTMPPADLEEIPHALQNVLLRSLAEESEERFADAGAFLAQWQEARAVMDAAPRKAAPIWKTSGVAQTLKPKAQAAAQQAGAWLKKAWGAARPLGEKALESGKALGERVKGKPHYLWWGLGLGGVLLVLIALSVYMLAGPTAKAPTTPTKVAATTPAPPTAAAPKGVLPPMGGGPPLVEGQTPATAAPAHPGEAKPAAKDERYLLVVGTYAGRASAQDLVKRLKARNLPAKIVASTQNGRQLFQVQVGPITDLSGAEEVANRIQEQEKLTPKIMKMTAKPTKPKKAVKPAPSRRPAR